MTLGRSSCKLRLTSIAMPGSLFVKALRRSASVKTLRHFNRYDATVIIGHAGNSRIEYHWQNKTPNGTRHGSRAGITQKPVSLDVDNGCYKFAAETVAATDGSAEDTGRYNRCRVQRPHRMSFYRVSDPNDPSACNSSGAG